MPDVHSLTEEDILGIYQDRDAVWFYNYRRGDPTLPHAELTSGLCSDGYVNSAPVMSDPPIAEFLARELTTRVRSRIGLRPVDWVVSSAYAAITFGYELARELHARHGFVEKDPSNPKRMMWQRFVIPSGSVVLQCEELITTLGTTREVRRAIVEANSVAVNFLPHVATAVWRPDRLDVSTGDLGIIALVSREVRSWKPEECPLCKQGSPRLRPKTHWRELIAK